MNIGNLKENLTSAIIAAAISMGYKLPDSGSVGNIYIPLAQSMRQICDDGTFVAYSRSEEEPVVEAPPPREHRVYPRPPRMRTKDFDGFYDHEQEPPFSDGSLGPIDIDMTQDTSEAYRNKTGVSYVSSDEPTDYTDNDDYYEEDDVNEIVDRTYNAGNMEPSSGFHEESEPYWGTESEILSSTRTEIKTIGLTFSADEQRRTLNSSTQHPSNQTYDASLQTNRHNDTSRQANRTYNAPSQTTNRSDDGSSRKRPHMTVNKYGSATKIPVRQTSGRVTPAISLKNYPVQRNFQEVFNLLSPMIGITEASPSDINLNNAFTQMSQDWKSPRKGSNKSTNKRSGTRNLNPIFEQIASARQSESEVKPKRVPRKKWNVPTTTTTRHRQLFNIMYDLSANELVFNPIGTADIVSTPGDSSHRDTSRYSSR